MSPFELTVLLVIAALVLWLTLFIFTVVDHFVYRGTYGHFLLDVDTVERQGGSSDAGAAAMAALVRRARTRYLARYVGNAASSRAAARLAAGEYVSRIGESVLLARAADAARRPRARIVALYALSRTFHPGTLPLLDSALGDPRPVLAYAALDMLDIHGSAEAAEVLLAALERDVLPASRIATHMERFPIDLTDVYVARLEAGSPKSRYWIGYLLGRSSYTPTVGQALCRLLDDPAADVRKVALSALATLDVPMLQSHAERMLDDPVFFVRTRAVRILSRFPDVRVVDALAHRLADEHDAVQLAAKRSLVELGAVALQRLPHVAPLLDARAAAAIPQITGTIRSALAVPAAPGSVTARGEAVHA